MIASIPSPSFNSIDIGPFSLNIYGLCIALGAVAAVWMFGRRLEQRGAGTTDDASAIGLVAVLAGVVGSRLYHVATDWDRFSDDLAAIPKLWEGGLGIPGGLLLGIPVGLWMSRRHGIPIAVAATCAAPAIPLAQAIGRWGNYFNQELYGRATDLPWALEIDADHLEPGYALGTTFHPTFLYESLWTLALAGVLLWIDRRYRPPDGQLMVFFVIGYGIGRFWIEGLRIDRADELAGLRWNQWVALAAVLGGLAVLALWPDRDAAADGDELDADDEDAADEDAADEDAADDDGLDAAVGEDTDEIDEAEPGEGTVDDTDEADTDTDTDEAEPGEDAVDDTDEADTDTDTDTDDTDEAEPGEDAVDAIDEPDDALDAGALDEDGTLGSTRAE